MMPWSMLLLAAILQAAPGPSPVETVARADMSGVEETRQAVARTAEEWAALWREHAGATPAPRIDFSKRMVVAVFLGTRPSAGYAAEITGTRAEGTGLVVLWTERLPERGMVAAQILTSPGHIVTVPRVAGPVRFEKAGQ
jgi:hypothetical protein